MIRNKDHREYKLETLEESGMNETSMKSVPWFEGEICLFKVISMSRATEGMTDSSPWIHKPTLWTALQKRIISRGWLHQWRLMIEDQTSQLESAAGERHPWWIYSKTKAI